MFSNFWTNCAAQQASTAPKIIIIIIIIIIIVNHIFIRKIIFFPHNMYNAALYV